MTILSRDRTRGRTGERQQGSAYLLTLMSLVVLTIVGLTVSFVTSTESQLSANERTMQESFYSSDSGMALSTAKGLWRNDQRTFTFVMNRRQRGNSDLWVANRVCVSTLQPISSQPCNLCEINQGAAFENVNHGVTAFAERVAWENATEAMPPADAEAVARRTTGKMVEFQPWDATIGSGGSVGGGNVFDDDLAPFVDAGPGANDCVVRY